MCVFTHFLCAQICGPGTPSFTCNLVGQPNGTYTSPSVSRNDTCCGSTNPDVCIKFTIFLDPQAVGINFSIASGAIPPGALFYQIACGPTIAVGAPICLNGPGPHILTFCKPGNNQNSYQITSIPGPSMPDSVLVRSGCSVTLGVTGLSPPTVSWTSINPGPPGTYNSYLNCTVGCETVQVTPTGTPPPFVDYQVSGFMVSPCLSNFYQDTVRVYFYSDLFAQINPSLATICFGQSNALLTATATGGLPPYTYSWSTGSNSQTVAVGPGTFTVQVNDNTGCPPTTATAVVNSFSLPISANAGPDQTLCKTNPVASLNGTVVMASGGYWNGGNGIYNPSQSSSSITYSPTLSELNTGSVQLTFTTTGNAGCPPGSDQIVLFYQNPPIANAGASVTVCANNNLVPLSGSISGFSSTPVWSSSGTGVFTSTSNLTTTYSPSPGDVSAGSVTLTLTTANNGVCPAANSTLQVLITPAPVANAGASQTICSNSPASLSGTISGPTNTGAWISSGSGTFSPSPFILNANYNPSNADINAGSVTLTLTSTGNGNCLAVSNTVNIAIIKIATVTAGPPQVICAGANTINITGTITGGTSSGIWTSNGTGAYNPGPTTVNNNTYTASSGDISQGSVIFTLTSSNNGPCPAVSDTTLLTIVPFAVVNAGVNQFVCSTAGTISLSGSSNPPASQWASNGTGTFFPNNFVINPIYTISQSDIANGFVTFTISSAPNGPCPIVTDSVRMNIKTIASVNSGSSQVICSTTGTISLSGNVSGGTSTGMWSTNGNGAFSPGANFVNSTYFVTLADVNAGVLIFTLSSTNNGPCPTIVDTLQLTIFKPAIVNAGFNQAICSTPGTVTLNGSVLSLSNTGSWISSGNGTFAPSNASLSTTYSIGPFDFNVGFAIFTLNSTNNGPCAAVADTVKVSIKKIALVNAGIDKTICSTSTNVPISGTVSGGSASGVWTSTAGGSFSPSNNFLNTSYQITSQDISNGNVSVFLTSGNNGVCPAVTDTMNIKIWKLPVINFTSDTVICSYQNPLKLVPNISGDIGQLVWSTTGSGNFTPGNQANPVFYDITKDIPKVFVKLIIEIKNNGPCGNVSATMDLTIRPTPEADFSPSTYTANILNDPVIFTNKSIKASKYSWDFGDGSTATAVSPTHNFQSVGFYDVTLVAYNQYGCTDTATKKILVISDIQFPNVFTPNQGGSNGGIYNVNDYSNDVFFPYTSGVTEYDLKIFNRWGELIFQSNELSVGWDGYFNGKLCQQDGYVWKADVKFFDGRTYNKTGSVTLLR
jgi:gliding motility-associated-like protein